MPRTETVERTVFKFAELSERAKQRAKEDYFQDWHYHWGDEALESIKKLAEHFDGKMSDWEIDWYGSSHSSAKFGMPEEWTEADIRSRLKTLGKFNPRTLQGHGDCKLTGFCFDEDAIYGFRKAFYAEVRADKAAKAKRLPEWAAEEVGGPPPVVEVKFFDLESLMQAAFDTWLKTCHEDVEYHQTDEAFAETCDANEYEFAEDGKMI